MRRPLAVAALALGACGDRATDAAAPPPVRSTSPAPATEPAPAAADVELEPAAPLPPIAVGLPPLPSPDHNPTTPAKVALGRLLFFEPRLGSGTMSCASCHVPARGWADGAARAATAAGQLNLRHTPSLVNTGHGKSWYWDGSMPNLEALVLSNWRGQLAIDPAEAVGRLTAIPTYQAHFTRAFGRPPTAEGAAEALAAYLRTVQSGGAPWDRHEAGEAGAVASAAIAGAAVFVRRAGCAGCHMPPLYTDDGYHVRLTPSELDPGRMRVTADPADRGAFKTPTLRGLVDSAPYFHDGSAATLEAAIDGELARDGIALAPAERAQLIAFVRSLSPAPAAVSAPALPR